VVLIHLADNPLAEMTLLGEHEVIAFAYCQLCSPSFLAIIFYIHENFGVRCPSGAGASPWHP
jgi:hypothetical protein